MAQNKSATMLAGAVAAAAYFFLLLALLFLVNFVIVMSPQPHMPK